MSKIAAFEAPFDLFETWFGEACEKESDVPNAVAVATATPDGIPSVRMVLLKEWDQEGFVFYTNFDSQKAQELLNNSAVALLFHWKRGKRQVRVEGHVEVVSDHQADAYFAERPRGSRIGAWASKQSKPMTEMLEFEAEIAKFTAKFGVGDIPRPDNWSGFRVVPSRFEFWQDRKFRLHDRHTYRLNDVGDGWLTEVLFP